MNSTTYLVRKPSLARNEYVMNLLFSSRRIFLALAHLSLYLCIQLYTYFLAGCCQVGDRKFHDTWHKLTLSLDFGLKNNFRFSLSLLLILSKCWLIKLIILFCANSIHSLVEWMQLKITLSAFNVENINVHWIASKFCLKTSKLFTSYVYTWVWKSWLVTSSNNN